LECPDSGFRGFSPSLLTKLGATTIGMNIRVQKTTIDSPLGCESLIPAHANGSLAPGYRVGTIGKVNSNVAAMNSTTFYGNQLPNATATLALRLVFY
jgi:hypothetical protein